MQTWASFQLAHKLTSTSEAVEGGVKAVTVLMFVQRLARLLKRYRKGQQLSISTCFHYFVREYESKPHWLNMLAMAFESRVVVLVCDGIAEAAGLRQDVQDLVRRKMVGLGQRVVATSRPEGDTPH